MSSEKRIYTQQGFTTIELAIVIIISGFISLMLLSVYSQHVEHERKQFTLNEALNLTGDTLVEYASSMQRYPCPAGPNLAPGDLNYGIERRSAGNPMEECATVDGIIAVNNGRDGRTVYIGAVPSQTLVNDGFIDYFTPAMALDGWGNKLTYAVTRDLIAQNAELQENDGGIYVSDNVVVTTGSQEDRDHGYSILETPGTAHAVLVSHGPNGHGAFTESGVELDGCSANTFQSPGNFTAEEQENCDRDDAIFITGAKRDVDGDVFDDYVEILNYSIGALWEMNDDNELIAKNEGTVAVGLEGNAIDSRAKLHVAGKAKANRLQSQNLCDSTRVDANGDPLCMPSDLISGRNAFEIEDGANALDDCPDGQVMNRIANNRGNCVTPTFSMPNGGFTCPTGHVITTLFSDGSPPVCSPM